MDGQYSWKRTEDIEIDLMDLLHRFLGQWKQILVCALVFAVAGAGFGYVKNRSSTGVSEAVTAEETELTETELQNVKDAAALEAEIRGLEEYMGNSILMQIDPYHKHKVILLYSIDHAKRNTVQKITETYMSFLVNGGLADACKESGISKRNIDKNYLAELVTAYQKAYSYPYQILADNSMEDSLQAESLFYVEITGSDETMARKLAETAQSALEKYQREVRDTAGNHRLELLDSEKNVISDSSLQEYQREKRTLLKTNRDSLQASVDAFSKEQMAVYQEAANIDREQEGQEKLPEEAIADSSGTGLKYIAAGFFGGVFFCCVVSACWYLLSDNIKSAEEIKKIYAFPFYGEISVKKQKTVRKASGKSQEPAEGQEYLSQKAQMLNRLRLACRKQGITKIYAASDFTLDSRERDCLEEIAMQLKNWGIEMVPAENAARNTAVWDDLAGAGNVLLVCRIGTSTHQAVDEAMRFYLENDIAVAGAMAF